MFSVATLPTEGNGAFVSFKISSHVDCGGSDTLPIMVNWNFLRAYF